MGTSSLSTVAQATDRPRATLPAGTLTLLHDAVAKFELSASTAQDGRASAEREGELTEVLERLCRDAHRGGLGPEAVIVALKHAYRSVPERLVHGETVSTKYWTVFRLCLRCYFGELS